MSRDSIEDPIRDSSVVFCSKNLANCGLYTEGLYVDGNDLCFDAWKPDDTVSLCGLFNAPCSHREKREHTPLCQTMENIKIIWVKEKHKAPRPLYYTTKRVCKNREFCLDYGVGYWVGMDEASKSEGIKIKQKEALREQYKNTLPHEACLFTNDFDESTAKKLGEWFSIPA